MLAPAHRSGTPQAVREARETAKAYKETRRVTSEAGVPSRRFHIGCGCDAKASGLPSFRLGILLANAKDYDGYSIDKALRRDDEHARILFQQAADIGHVGAQVSSSSIKQVAGERGGVP